MDLCTWHTTHRSWQINRYPIDFWGFRQTRCEWYTRHPTQRINRQTIQKSNRVMALGVSNIQMSFGYLPDKFNRQGLSTHVKCSKFTKSCRNLLDWPCRTPGGTGRFWDVWLHILTRYRVSIVIVGHRNSIAELKPDLFRKMDGGTSNQVHTARVNSLQTDLTDPSSALHLPSSIHHHSPGGVFWTYE